MQLPSENTIQSVRLHYREKLSVLYDDREADQLFFLVAEHQFNWKKSMLFADPKKRLSESEMLKFHFILKELITGKPVQYVLGETEFFGLPFLVNESVLIPRPETEELVQQAIDFARENRLENPLILDACTGSGCIAVTMKQNLPHAEVMAFDVSEAALKTATKNAEMNKVDIAFSKFDLLQDNAGEEYNTTFDLILSNPPYVPESDQAGMHSNVLDYEPAIALFVPDSDALIFYRLLLDKFYSLLSSGGLFLVEIHESLGVQTCELFLSKGFQQVEIIQDLQGKNRMIKAIK